MTDPGCGFYLLAGQLFAAVADAGAFAPGKPGVRLDALDGFMLEGGFWKRRPCVRAASLVEVDDAEVIRALTEAAPDPVRALVEGLLAQREEDNAFARPKKVAVEFPVEAEITLSESELGEAISTTTPSPEAPPDETLADLEAMLRHGRTALDDLVEGRPAGAVPPASEEDVG